MFTVARTTQSVKVKVKRLFVEPFFVEAEQCVLRRNEGLATNFNNSLLLGNPEPTEIS